MPINRIPVVHKFGIVSQTKRVELEKRIAKKAYLESRHGVEAQRTQESRPLPFEVTQEFVYKFNDCSNDERDKMKDTGMKMLERLKRLAGLRHAGDAYHVDVSRAWLDLALLSQCRWSKLEEACLMALIASLDQAVVSKEHILSLFYLAKSGIYWLKKDTGNECVLQSNEILLIKMTRLVFLRLYCHHILGQLMDYGDQRASLQEYMAGFQEKEKSFEMFPDCHLSIRLIIEAGRYIVFTKQYREFETNSSHVDDEDRTRENTKTVGDVKATDVIEIQHSAFLYCCLQVWYAVNTESKALNQALHALLDNISRLEHEEWLDVILAFHILSDASRQDVRVLKTLQYLISFDFSYPVETVQRAPHLCDTCYSSFPTTPYKSPLLREDQEKMKETGEKAERTSSNLVKNFLEFLDPHVKNDDVREEGMIGVSKDERRHQQSRRWPWQLLYTFCDCLATVCLHGACSDVKKYSLMGINHGSESKNKMKSGLIEFLTYDEGDNDWKVRFAALKGLVRVCSYRGNDVSQNCFTDAAWSAVMTCLSVESETRVVEGFKIAKTEAEFEKRFKEDRIPTALWTSRIASALIQMLQCEIFSSDVVTCPEEILRKDTIDDETGQESQAQCRHSQKIPKKTTLRQEIRLADLRLKQRKDYTIRRNEELRAVIEDQWKKELLKNMEEEIKENIEQLEKERTKEIEATQTKEKKVELT